MTIEIKEGKSKKTAKTLVTIDGIKDEAEAGREGTAWICYYLQQGRYVFWSWA